MNKPSWQEVAEQVQYYRDNTVRKVRPKVPDLASSPGLNVTSIPGTLLSSQEVTITEATTEDLVSSLATGQLTSREVTSAFLRRAAIAQDLVRSNQGLYSRFLSDSWP